ncbi:MAG: PE-PPE domain-containing protein [Mycobacterium sp.]
MNDLYLHCDAACTPEPLFTPEQWFPLLGVLPYDVSVFLGTLGLNSAIQDQLAGGNDVTVFGYSQSATVSTFEMRGITEGIAGIQPDAHQLSFVLIGDPNNPNGGILERYDLLPQLTLNTGVLGFPPLNLPSAPGFLSFSGATPVTEYPTDIYTLEYDPIGDFPRYPIDVLSDVNAILGFPFVHLDYMSLTAAQTANAVEVPTSAGYDGDTTYYVIPTEDLPLLDPLRSIPVIGPLMSDLVQPDLEVLVNLGYGDPEYGWVNSDADVPTPFGLFPSSSDLDMVPALLQAGLQQGIQNVMNDLQNPVNLLENPLVDLAVSPVVWAILTAPIPEVLSLVGLN